MACHNCICRRDKLDASPRVFHLTFQITAMGHLKLLPGLLSQPTYVLGLSVLLPLVIFLVISVKSYYRLSHIPGPFFARFTNIPRLLWVKSFNAHRIHIDLHKKYGPIVRFGPNMVSVGDPGEIGTIYSFKKPWPKVRGNNKGST